MAQWLQPFNRYWERLDRRTQLRLGILSSSICDYLLAVGLVMAYAAAGTVPWNDAVLAATVAMTTILAFTVVLASGLSRHVPESAMAAVQLTCACALCLGAMLAFPRIGALFLMFIVIAFNYATFVLGRSGFVAAWVLLSLALAWALYMGGFQLYIATDTLLERVLLPLSVSLVLARVLVIADVVAQLRTRLRERNHALVAAQAQLEDKHDLLVDIVDALPLAVLVFDTQERLSISNPVAKRYWSSDTLAVLTLQAAVKRWPVLGQLLEGQAQSKTVTVMQHGERALLIGLQRVRGEDADAAWTVLTIADVSLAQQARRERDEAINFMSRELQGPLADAMRLLEATSLDRTAQREQLARHLRRTAAMMDNFVAVARATRVSQASFQPLELVEVAYEAVDRCAPLAAERGVEVEVEADVAGAVRGDWAMLLCGMSNLLGNAITHAPPGGRVVLRIVLGRGRFIVSVEGPGPGLDAGLLGLIARNDLQALLAARRGRGMGLVAAAHIAAAHGGSLSASNIQVGGSGPHERAQPGARVQFSVAVRAATGNVINFSDSG